MTVDCYVELSLSALSWQRLCIENSLIVRRTSLDKVPVTYEFYIVIFTQDQVRMLGYQVKRIGLTIRSALNEISATKAAIVKLVIANFSFESDMDE